MKKVITHELISVMVIVGLAIMAMSLLQPVLPVYLTTIGVTPTTLGLMLSAGMMGMVLGESFGGWIADRKSIRVPMFIGTFFCVPMVLSFILFESTVLLFVVFFFWGVVRAAVFGPGRGYIGTHIPISSKATLMAVYATAMQVSRALGTSASGFITDIWGYNWIFVGSAGISMLGGLMVVVGLKNRSHREVVAIADTRAPTGVVNSVPEVALYRYRPFIVQSVIAALYFSAMGAMPFLSLMAAQVAGLPVTQVGILFTISAVVSAVMLIPMGRIADRKSKRLLMTVGLLITALSFIGISFSRDFLHLAASQVVGAIGGSMFSPAAVALLSENVPQGRQNTAMGIYGGCEDIGAILGSALGGAVWTVLGAKATFLIAGALPAAVGATTCFTLLKESIVRKRQLS